MSKVRRLIVLFIMVLLITNITGCKLDTKSLLKSTVNNTSPKFIKVEINFTDGVKLEGYVENLEIAQSGKVYAGGSSINYIYNQNGEVTGCFNYQRVLYMKILPEKNKPAPAK